MTSNFDKLNMVSIKECYEIILESIRHQLSAPFTKHMNFSITGSPGVGKSSIVRKIADLLDMHLIDLRLSTRDESSILGVPYVYNGVMYESTPHWWPEDVTKPVILFLDEFWNSKPEVQTAAYQLLLDRTILNGKKLPDNCFIIAAGNLKSDKTGARDPLPAAANRFSAHLEIDRSRLFGPFMEWAQEAKFDPMLLAFLEWDRSALYGKIGEEVAYATPRTIEDVNNHITVYKNDYLLNITIAGAVGSEWAHKFAGFREHAKDLPDYELIKKGDKKYSYEKKEGDVGLDFAIAVTAAHQFLELFGTESGRDKQDLEIMGDRLMDIVEMIDIDIQVIFMRNMKRNIRALQASRSVRRFDKLFMDVTDRNL